MRTCGLCLAVLAVVGMMTISGGCTGAPGTNTRNVTSVPGPGFVSFDTTLEQSATNLDSALAKVFAPQAVCNVDETDDFEEFVGTLLYEVGEAGAVLSVTTISEIQGEQFCATQPQENATFVVADGCLSLQFQDPDADPDEEPDDPIDETPDTSPLCGDNGIALGRDGVITADETDEDYICITLAANEQVDACRQADGEWTQQTSVTITYTAQGSLDNVSVAEWFNLCGEEEGGSATVNISQGDSITATVSGTITFATSQTPEELGCSEETEIPGIDDIDIDFDDIFPDEG